MKVQGNIHVKEMEGGGRLYIPAPIIKALGIKDKERVVMTPGKECIRVILGGGV